MATGLIQALLLDGAGRGRTLATWDEVVAWHPNDGVLWLNLDYSIDDVASWLRDRSQIDPLVLAALVDPDPRPRAVAHGEDLLMIVRAINLNQGAEPEDMISVRCFIEPRRIVTLRHRVSRSLDALVAEVAAGSGPIGAGDFTARFVERTLDLVVTRVDVLGDEIAGCEDEVLDRQHGADMRGRLADHRRRAIQLRRFLAPQREALGKLATISLPWLDAMQRARMVEAADRMTRTVEELDAARDRAAVTQEELASRVGEVTNQRLYFLSLVTAIFLPLGFMCSLLALPMQHDSWQFWTLIAAFGAGVIAQRWWFKKRGWL
ncbi:MAG TPA: CorA family divalent cation transporter [Kofleriaceae bacterium]|nr:CorA family divalent cation transporter [Kofleriaceae bacterium]